MSKRKQPQRLPPPIMHGDEAIDNEVVLREMGEAGVPMWKTVRSVRLWADLGPGERSGAFDPEAAHRRSRLLERTTLPEALAKPLGRAAGVLEGGARAPTVAKACREVAEWCAEEGKLGTAIEFMQAAAMVVPADAEIAHEVARLARGRTEYQRAETWYREAISRARRARNWHEFARSYIGLGKVFTLRGAYPQAVRSLMRGLRAATRFSIRPLIAAAAHELVVVAFKTDRAAEVARYARLAVDAYGPRNPRLPALAHDVGVFLLNAGYLDSARRILTSTPPSFGRPLDQLAHWSALVRLAGALGDQELYAEALGHAERLLDDAGTAQGAVQAHLAIARGADSIGDTDRALRAAATAKAQAAARGEAQPQFAVESLLESIRSRPAADAGALAPLPTPNPLRYLVDDLEAALAAGSATR